jgi:hypothetical protein
LTLCRRESEAEGTVEGGGVERVSEGKAAESCGVGEYGNALDGVAIVSVAAREAAKISTLVAFDSLSVVRLPPTSSVSADGA